MMKNGWTWVIFESRAKKTCLTDRMWGVSREKRRVNLGLLSKQRGKQRCDFEMKEEQAGGGPQDQDLCVTPGMWRGHLTVHLTGMMNVGAEQMEAFKTISLDAPRSVRNSQRWKRKLRAMP